MEYFDEDSGDYPLLMASPAWKNFRNDLGDFLTVCKSNFIFKKLKISCSALHHPLQGQHHLRCEAHEPTHQVAYRALRAFRHTATFAGFLGSTFESHNSNDLNLKP
jgi:hypothetical protein